MLNELGGGAALKIQTLGVSRMDFTVFEGPDIVTLLPFADYIANPELIKDLMVEQGNQDIDYIEIVGKNGGGTSPLNYKALLHWLDGSQSRALIKGARPDEAMPASFREALFFSRVQEDLDRNQVTVFYPYLALADMESGKALTITPYLSGYSSMQDVIVAFYTNQLPRHLKKSFDVKQANVDVMSLLGHFAGTWWMDHSLDDKFFLKNWEYSQQDPLNPEDLMGKEVFEFQKKSVNDGWNRIKVLLKQNQTIVATDLNRDLSGYMITQIQGADVNPKQIPEPISDEEMKENAERKAQLPKHTVLELSDNTVACIEKVLFENWNWENFVEKLQNPNYRWGMTHGDFHPGQVMYQTAKPNQNQTDRQYILFDWEFAGMFGNPAIDISTWLSVMTPDQLEHTDEYFEAYYKSLSEHIDQDDQNQSYSLEQLKKDYIEYGPAQVIARYIGLSGLYPAEYAQFTLDIVENFLDQNKITPDNLSDAPPMYGYFDFLF